MGSVELIGSTEEVLSSFEHDLELMLGGTSTSYYEYRQYISALKPLISDITNDDLQRISFAVKNSSTWTVHWKEVCTRFRFADFNKSQGQKLRFIFVGLIASACRKKIIVADADFSFNSPFTRPERQIDLRNPVISLYPRFCLELLLTGTPNRFSAHKLQLEYDWSGVEKKFSSWKSWNKNVLDVFNLMLAYGLDHPEQIKPDMIEQYRLARNEIGLGVFAWRIVASFLDDKHKLNIVSEASKLSSLRRGSKAVKKSKYATEKKDGDFRVLTHKSALEKSNLYLDRKETIVFEPIAKPKEISIGGYSMQVSELENFKVEGLEKDSLWYQSQRDYLDFDDVERSTRKTRDAALRYLNAYLFGYLPYYFSHSNSPFEFPSSPEIFYGHVFVKPSLVMLSKMGSEALDSELPVSLPEFVLKFGDVRETSKSDNSLRDTLNRIRGFFDYLISNYPTVPGFRLSKNPLDLHQKRGGSKHSSSVKTKFELYYWVYFRVYTRTVSKRILLKAAQQILEGAKTKGRAETVRELDGIIKSLKSLIKETEEGSELNPTISIAQYSDKSVKVPVYKEFYMDSSLRPLKINSIDLSNFKKKSIDLDGAHVPISHFDYQSFVGVLIIAFTGLRLSNVNWIDSDDFDCEYDQDNDLPMDSLVRIRIATDKVKRQGLESLVPKEVMETLIIVKKLRALNVHSGFRNPISYQDNPKSKFKQMRPLLQSTSKNLAAHYNLGPFLMDFENHLYESGIDFKSVLSYAPVNVKLADFNEIKISGIVPSSLNYYIQYDGRFQEIPFTSIQLKTSLTAHSLRKQLVSVFDILLSDREAIQMLTGQSEQVIGYYSDNTPEEESQLRLHRNELLDTLVLPINTQVSTTDLEHLELARAADTPNVEGSSRDFGFSFNKSDITERDDLAFNWTHICPFGNHCPSDVVSTIGRMNCAECPKAIATKHHAPAIAAKIRKLLDEVRDNVERASRTEVSEPDLRAINYEIEQNVREASYWKVRLNAINQYGISFGDKSDILNNMRYLRPGTFKYSLWLRLKETKDAPMLQSERLKMLARRASRELLMKVKSQPDLLAQVDKYDSDDDVNFALACAELVADFIGVSVQDLPSHSDQTLPSKLMEALE